MTADRRVAKQAVASDPAGTRLIGWLLAGDPAIEFQTGRDLLDDIGPDTIDAQRRIALEGWGKRFLAARRPDGHWGRGFYQPKWTSTHYTLLDLANLGLPRDNTTARESVDLVLDAPRGRDGGINFAATLEVSDVCINGMILNYATWFRPDDSRLPEIADYLIARRQPDGGWNCEYWRGSRKSSLHSTLSVVEGLTAFMASRPNHRRRTIEAVRASGIDFVLGHRLYQTRNTGKIIDPRFLRLTYPGRWRFDILRALDAFRLAGVVFDERMSDAIDVLRRKRRADGRWSLAAPHPGQVHFHMEQIGKPSRWNTLRALRVLRQYGGPSEDAEHGHKGIMPGVVGLVGRQSGEAR
jgi:hypothetical protein